MRWLLRKMFALPNIPVLTPRRFSVPSVKRGIVVTEKCGWGSTLSQQLAKQLFTRRRWQAILMQRLFQKPIEWVIAVKLERYYTKRKFWVCILISSTSWIMLSVLRRLRILISAVNRKIWKLSRLRCWWGMCKNPSLYNPVPSKIRASRWDIVMWCFDQMRKAGYIYWSRMWFPPALSFETDIYPCWPQGRSGNLFPRISSWCDDRTKPVKSQLPRLANAEVLRRFTFMGNDPLYGWCAKE